MLGNTKHDDGFVELDRITKNPKYPTFRLSDDQYQKKILYAKYSDELFQNPKYWIWSTNKLPTKREIKQEKNAMISPDYTLVNLDSKDFEYIDIYKSNLHNSIPYFSSWWTLCHFFTEKYYNNKESLHYFTEFRTSLMHYTKKFGGDKIFYIDNQNIDLEGVGKVKKVY